MSNSTTTDKSTANRQKYIEKLLKLYALAKGNKSQGERENAQAAAEALKAQWDITEEELREAEGRPVKATSNEWKDEFDFDQDYDYVKTLLSAASRLNDVRVLYRTDMVLVEVTKGKNKGQKRWQDVCYPVMFGTEVNILSCQMQVGFFFDSIWEEIESPEYDDYSQDDAVDFCRGCADQLLTRALELRAKKNDAATTTGTSLMVIRNQYEVANQDELTRYMNANGLSFSRARTEKSRVQNGAAYQNGREHGKGMNLGKQVGQHIGGYLN